MSKEKLELLSDILKRDPSVQELVKAIKKIKKKKK